MLQQLRGQKMDTTGGGSGLGTNNGGGDSRHAENPRINATLFGEYKIRHR